MKSVLGLLVSLYLQQTPTTHTIPTIEQRYEALHTQHRWLSMSMLKTIDRAAARYDLPSTLIISVIQNESEGYVRAQGPSVRGHRAVGLMQVMAHHHYKNGSRSDLFKPSVNIMIGTRYLRYCYVLARGDLKKTLKNYNSGPASRFYNTPYIKRIIKNKKVLDNLTARL